MHLPEHDLQALNGATVFLLQAWSELFDQNTPDTCQPRIFHTGHLVSEILSVGEQAISNRRFHKHFEAVRLELQSAIAKEAHFLERLPQFHWLIKNLAEEQSPTKSVVQARVLEGSISEYETAANQALREAVRELPAKKEKAFEALNRFASVVIRAGRTPTECLNLISPGLWRSTPQEVVEAFIAFSSPTAQRFTCSFVLEGISEDCHAALESVGFSANPTDARLSTTLPLLGQNEAFVVASTHASTPGIAVQQLASRLRQVVDVFNFHHNSPRLKIETTAFAAGEDGEMLVVPLSDVALRRLSPRKKTAKLTQELVSSPTALDQLSDRFLNALEHSSLAQTSANPRMQLISMWAALECLVGPSPNRSILDHVVESIIPVVIHQRSEKTVRYLGIALRSLWTKQPDQSLGSGFTHSKKFVFPEEVFVTLCKPENHPDITGLLRFSSANPLLCNRLFIAWKIFSNPCTLAHKLSGARKTLEWHLSRIYRATNLIIHQGVDIPHLPWLLDHLHYYFAAACGRILDALKANPTWGIDEALASWKNKCEYLLHGLQNHPKAMKVSDLIRSPEILSDYRPWGQSS